MIEQQDQVFNRELNNNDLPVLIEQYKVYVESVNLTSQLRSQANTFSLSINTALISFVGAISQLSGTTRANPAWIFFICATGIILSLNWFFAIRSYRSLNSGRFRVIHELETRLPARIYEREWQIVTGQRPGKAKYVRQTFVEQVIPITFILLYIALLISSANI